MMEEKSRLRSAVGILGRTGLASVGGDWTLNGHIISDEPPLDNRIHRPSLSL